MAALWSRIRSEAPKHDTVGKLLEALNAIMFDLLAEEGFFATIILGKYWPARGQMEVALGGHQSVIKIFRNECENISEKRGPSLGIMPSATFEEESISLSQGQSILLITDGVTEAFNERGDLFGQQRLTEFFKNAEGPPWGPGLLNAVKRWRGLADASDDLTILEIWRESM
jgi:serine phosphatase RsbU (regulator of sigma subunit)